jgi:hypothetical protein
VSDPKQCSSPHSQSSLPSEELVVGFAMIVAVPADPVGFETLMLAFVWPPDWGTAPAVVIPSSVPVSGGSMTCFPETHPRD